MQGIPPLFSQFLVGRPDHPVGSGKLSNSKKYREHRTNPCSRYFLVPRRCFRSVLLQVIRLEIAVGEEVKIRTLAALQKIGAGQAHEASGELTVLGVLV